MKFFNQDSDTNSVLTSLVQCLTNYRENQIAPFIANQISGPITTSNVFRMIGVLQYDRPAGLIPLLNSFPAGVYNPEFDAWLAPKILANDGRLGFLGNIGFSPIDQAAFEAGSAKFIWQKFDGVTNWVVASNNYDTCPLFNAVESTTPLTNDLTFAGQFVWFGPPSP